MVDRDRENRENGAERPWIRGVNIGGWLLMERFITPYFFAITSCHIQGDFCWYPGQINAPPVGSPDHQYCDLYNCKPHLIDSAAGGQDFPTDEYTLAASFPDKDVARRYFQYHWDNFVTLDDLKELKAAGVTHVRVPLSHWIVGNIEEGEPWVDGGWPYFVRFVSWCRGLDIQVWPDVHTAPGSQNGFDNSGQLLAGGPTCLNWSGNDDNVQRSLQVVRDITKAINRDGLSDVVTGFGVLNEQFGDCDRSVVRRYNTEAYNIVTSELGADTNVYIGDMFNATTWNDGWWTDEDEYSNTILDSHYYHGTRLKSIIVGRFSKSLISHRVCCLSFCRKASSAEPEAAHRLRMWS
jgi:glucan 1,3-beta-glucosidase